MAKQRKNEELACYLLPGSPMPIVLPTECVAEVVPKPAIEALASASANWMIGHVTWQNQRLPVMSFSALNNPELDESKKRKPNLVVLNPVPGAARKVYTGLLCFGDIKNIKVVQSASIIDIPESVDKRYIEAVIKIGRKQMVIPKLSALSVAFSYF